MNECINNNSSISNICFDFFLSNELLYINIWHNIYYLQLLFSFISVFFFFINSSVSDGDAHQNKAERKRNNIWNVLGLVKYK